MSPVSKKKPVSLGIPCNVLNRVPFCPPSLIGDSAFSKKPIGSEAVPYHQSCPLQKRNQDRVLQKHPC